jgi:vancomycin resistance protein VanJ
VLFAPRWPWLVPLVLLVPLAIWFRPRMLIVLLLAAATGLGPLMGFCVGWRRFEFCSKVGITLRVVAFNVHHSQLMDPSVVQFVADVHPDVIALEEAPRQFNQQLFCGPGWYVLKRGELCLASRYPIVSSSVIWQELAARFVVDVLGRPVEIIVVHLSSPHYALRDAARSQLGGSEELSSNIERRRMQAEEISQLSATARGPLLIVGDFNLTPDSRFFAGRFPSMTDVFEAIGLGFRWTYKNNWTEVRIDHILVSNAFDCQAFSIGPFLGSPHRPIIAELVLKSTS